jgi:hypothetical protein
MQEVLEAEAAASAGTDGGTASGGGGGDASGGPGSTISSNSSSVGGGCVATFVASDPQPRGGFGSWVIGFEPKIDMNAGRRCLFNTLSFPPACSLDCLAASYRYMLGVSEGRGGNMAMRTWALVQGARQGQTALLVASARDLPEGTQVQLYRAR